MSNKGGFQEGEKAAMHRKLQILRSITNSHAENETAVLLDASKYIKQLKQKVETLNHQNNSVVAAQKPTYSRQNLPLKVAVERQASRFVIKVTYRRNCSGLLVYILEAIEELGLEVLEARVSCSDDFYLEATGIYENDDQEDNEELETHEVKEALLEAIESWSNAANDNFR